MSVESYGQGATFVCRTSFQIPCGFKLILKTVRLPVSDSERIFVNLFKPFIGMMHMIYRWIAIEKEQKTHVDRFPKIDSLFKQN